MDIEAYDRILDLTIEVAGLFLNLAGNFSSHFCFTPTSSILKPFMVWLLLTGVKQGTHSLFFGLVVHWMQAKSFAVCLLIARNELYSTLL